MPNDFLEGAKPVQAGQDFLSGAKPVVPQGGTPPAQPGFFANLADSFGIGPKSIQAAQQDQTQHPIRSAIEKYVPGAQLLPFARGLYGMGKESVNQIQQAHKAGGEGNYAGSASHLISAIPLVGPALNKMNEEAPPTTPGQSYMSQVLSAATPGNVGTALGTAAQIAPAVLGAADMAAPGRPIIPNPPNPLPAIRTAAIGDPDAEALRGLRVPAGSPKSLRTVSAVQSSRPYLQGVSSLEDLQGKLPGAKSETWGPYQKTVDEIGDTPVKGPGGEPTTIKALESERKQLSALNRGLKTGNPESMQVAQQKGMSQAELLDREKAVQAALDPRLQEAGIDPQAIRQQFGQLKTIEGRIAGRSTLAEKPQPYGFGKMANLSIEHPLQAPAQILSGARDLVAGRPLWSGKPTDISLREAFRPGGEKPNFGEFKPGAPITSVPPLFAADRGLVRPTEPLAAPDFIRKPKIDTWTGRNQ